VIDRSAHALYVGSVVGGRGPENASTTKWISQLALWADDLQQDRKSKPAIALDIAFHVPGPVLGIDWTGVRSGSYWAKDGILQVQASVPSTVVSDDQARGYFIEALPAILDCAERAIQRRRLTADLAEHRELVDAMIERLREPDP
jgi:hypothetical protein